MRHCLVTAALTIALQGAQVCLSQAGGPASLQVPATGSTAVFSVVPIVGATAEITPQLSGGVYGLYSTDPQVEILCVAAPFRLNSVFTVNPIYEFISPPPDGNGHKERESQVNIALDSGFAWKNLHISDRNRVGRRLVDYAADSTRYRNLPSVTYLLPGKTKLSLFHWQEFFYEGSVARWDQHHLAAGLQRPLGGHLLTQLYYFRLAATGRGDIHALGLTLIYNHNQPLFHQAAK